MIEPLHIIGGGLAGCEAAWQAAERNVPVVLHEMRPISATEAHQTDNLAELVCSNSLRSDDSEASAVGLLHDELRRCGSLILRMADAHKLPAGGALAVDREAFAATITGAVTAHPLITLRREEIAELDGFPESAIIATGPLTSPALAENIRKLTGMEHLHFFDAIAPIVHRDSIDMSKAWMQSRYDKAGPGGTGADYINCAMDKAQYEAFIHELLTSPKTEFREWEKSQSRLREAQSSRDQENVTPYFEGCLPIEVMASRGADTLRYGPMKPVGLTNPHTNARPYAVVQLRQDNALGTLYNLVGFQTKLKYAEQERVFRAIPGLENAVFARLGGLHRNTFINSPLLLDAELRMKSRPGIRFAGQITGVEGYVESTAIGLLAGLFAAAGAKGKPISPPPRETALGALLAHITVHADVETFQPMNVNFGLFPPVELPPKVKGSRPRKLAMTARAKEKLGEWLGELNY
ncbi:MAG: methylenetetrahydrofolate--tRNA-(uracil(54)-C(5))-methyltransferase (FADH(2)-oxidizing) TrmFO [Alphaproteobacteria bacterium]|nr:methylenetetrahydrofolate--tRNA-(uracil(54)-C(5))-methyltransferase (FADH(2)-oxidizing) TrmFO [Alphaproteobacteria bacterium]